MRLITRDYGMLVRWYLSCCTADKQQLEVEQYSLHTQLCSHVLKALPSFLHTGEGLGMKLLIAVLLGSY